jgi:hypothetical protein
MIANISSQGKHVNSMESGTQGGSNHTGKHRVSQAISGPKNLRRKMEEIGHERAAFKIE